MIDEVIRHQKPFAFQAYEWREKLGDDAQMTSAGVLDLLDILASNVENHNCYLEVGVWRGASLCYVAQRNRSIKCFGVDNFSEFEGKAAKKVVRERIAKTIDTHQCNITLMEGGWKNVLNKYKGTYGIPPIELFFYDGSHKGQDHRKAVEFIRPYLADEAIIIVDDTGKRDGPRYKQVMQTVNKDKQLSYLRYFGDLGPENYHCGLMVLHFERKR
jgi:hypothetical protein